jgi:hypothetical protein
VNNFWLKRQDAMRGSEQVKSSICVCCGEPMTKGGGVLSRDPNLCASCSSIADGMAEEDCEEVSREHKEAPVGMPAIVEAEAKKVLMSEQAHEDRVSQPVSRQR